MAITWHDGSSNATGNGSSIGLFSIAMTAGDLLVITVGLLGNTVSVSQITDTDGNVWSLQKRVVSGTICAVEIWTATAKATHASGINGYLTITLSGSAEFGDCFDSYTGWGSLGNTGTNTGSSTSASVTVTAQQSGSWILAAAVADGCPRQTFLFSATSPDVIRENVQQSTALATAEGDQGGSGSAGSQTIAFALSQTQNWAMAGIEVLPPGGTQHQQAMTATVVTSTATMSKLVNKLLLTPTPRLGLLLALFQQNNVSYVSVATTSLSLTKVLSVMLTASVSSAASLVKTIAASVFGGVTSASTASLVKQVGLQGTEMVASVVVSTATLIKQVGKLMSASSSASATLLKQVGKLLSASSSASATLVKQVGKILTASSSAVGTLTKQVGKLLSATSSATAFLTTQKVKLVAMTATAVTSAATLTKQVGKNLTASSTSVAAFGSMLILKVLSASSTTTATMIRTIARILLASSTAAVSLTKMVARSMVASSSAIATLVAVFKSATPPFAGIIKFVFKGVAQAGSSVITMLQARASSVLGMQAHPGASGTQSKGALVADAQPGGAPSGAQAGSGVVKESQPGTTVVGAQPAAGKLGGEQAGSGAVGSEQPGKSASGSQPGGGGVTKTP